MERSTEVEDVVRAMWTAMRESDAAGLTDAVSSDEGVLWIGTDPEEWWTGPDEVKRVVAEQLEASGGFDVVNTDPVAYVDGAVAWAADHGAIRLPDGTEVPIRATFVFRRESAGWKVVQAHASVGAANAEVLGEDLPT